MKVKKANAFMENNFVLDIEGIVSRAGLSLINGWI
jgi:hypothetical protein